MTPLSHTNEAESLAVEGDIGGYRPVSGLAVVGLLLGVFSIVAFVHYLLYLVPLAAIVINVLALRQIAETSPPMIGRRAALAGLALAMICVGSAPVQRAVHRRDLHAQSLEVAREWFTALREDRPEAACRLSRSPTTAAARAQSPMKLFESGMMSLERMRKFVHESPVDLLLKLGKRAHVRLYANEDIWWENDKEGVRDFYVVTVGQGPQAVSFFIWLGTTRTKEIGTGEWQWQVTKSEFIHTPPPELLDVLGR
ncbi:MAG TPA: hypothetical protein VG826_23995 [Pirellulales bacterium]|nr:hypothetical protein [Pirellulales bacterium]